MKTNRDQIKTAKQIEAQAARRRVLAKMVHEIETTPLRQPSLRWALLLQRALPTRQR